MIRHILVTGASGFLGQALLKRLHTSQDKVYALDVRETPTAQRFDGVTYVVGDIRDEQLGELFAEHNITHVVHLASIVTPDANRREFEYSVDVLGTQNILRNCIEHRVEQFVYASSGAAYGYHADNADWLTEDMPLRGNESFTYSWHKRLAEEACAKARQSNPELRQVILRIGTILGESVDSQVTKLFSGKRILAIRGADSPFVFIWDTDVANIVHCALNYSKTGIFNVAGDGKLSIQTIAKQLNKPLLTLPAGALRTALAVAKRLKLTQYGPDQLDFLRYRPVLLNTALKETLGYTPEKTSQEAFTAFIEAKTGS